MSTLPGQASKGEKTKSKFQSLDINSLYRVSRGENLEKQQQKSSSVYIKHGMQSLGKVPNARRAPANLPSLKAEYSGSDAAVPLVPPGAQGWGKQDANAPASATAQPPLSTSPSNPPSQNSAAAPAATPNQPPASQQISQHQAAIALPVTNPIPPHPHKQSTSSAPPAPVDKLWSSVMSGQDVPHPPLYHSPQFQHEFPSLSAGDGGPTRTGSDAPQYPSGLSLRPQTEGSWTQGGQRPVGATGVENAGQNRPNSGPQGAQPQHSAQAGQQPQQQQFPPQMRGVMPSFMYKGSGFQQNPQGNGVPPNSQNAPPPSVNGRGNRSGADGRPPRLGGPDRETDEALPRPIIKEEELNRMDEIGKDMGWAESDEIDYNQKLAFSDDEGDRAAKKDNKRRHHKEDGHGAEAQPRQWGAAAAPRANAAPRSRPTEEEDIWTQRRNQTDKEVEIAVQRAKQRKEEEEKRFQEERKQAAAKKLMELEEKIQKRDRDTHEAVAAPQKTSPDKEQTANHEPSPTEEKTSPQSVGSSGGSSFRQLTQIEGKNFPPRKHNKPADTRESNAPFSKNFQNDLPPRFLKHQRNNSSSNLQQQQFDSRWSQNATKHQQGAANNNRTSPEIERSVEERKEYVRQSSEDSYRSSHHSQQEVPAAKSYDAGRYDEKSPPMRGHKDKEEDKRPQQQQQQKKSVNEDWSDHRNHPNSSEKGRHSRDYMSPWSEYDHSTGYEEAKKREERRVVPGPITKERIEAEDLRSEKRNLTQLKRGQPVEVRSEIKKLEEEKKESQQQQQFVSAWADSIPPAIEEQSKKLAEEKKNNAEGQQKTTVEQSAAAAAAKKQDKPSYGQKKGWAGNNPGNDYHSARGGQPWQGGSGGRRPHSRNRRSNRAEFHGTDSDGSQDDHQKVEAAATDHHHQKSPKSMRRNDGKPEKFGGKPEKQEKRENYVPRGEPSRHGRGGGNFRSGGGGSGRMSSMGKKIDGYGPPPAKSPFGGHHDDKEKKPLGQEDAAAENVATVEDKIKQNQQALAAGIIGKRSEALPNDDKKALNRPKQELRKNNNKPNEVVGGSTENAADKEAGRKPQGGKAPSRPAPAQNRGRNNTPRGTSEKRYEPNPKLSGKKDDKEQQNSADVPNVDDKSENNSATNVAGDSEGFQEVKSKKTAGKERQKSSEDKSKTAAPKADTVKDSKPMERDRKSKTQQLTPQQIQNIPSLMATPVNPPPILPKSNFDNRGRQTSKLPPRFAKQKLQKQAMQQQQQQHLCDLNDISKVNQNAFGAAPAPPACAWDKPLVAQLRGLEQDNILGVSVEAGKGLEPSSQLSEKLVEKPLLDGTTAPVNTIIFENTNFKSAPGARAGPPRNDKPPRPEAGMEMASGFGKSNVNELLQQQQQSKNEGKDAMQLPLFKEDMKIDFFNADLQFSDDKASKSYVAKSIHAITSGNNTVDSLDIKIASVKKVWETSEQEGEDNQMTFGGAQLDSNVFNQSKDVSEDNHEGYSPSANQTAQTNVCKVKPTQQVSGGGQTAMGSTHQAHAGMVAASLMGNPLSPPPMPPVLGAGVGMGPQFTANQHLGYQTGLSGSTQYGISAIPSPPTVPLVYNSSQQLQSAVQTANLYGAFQLDQLGGQGRSQFSQYANYHGLGQTPNSPYTTPNVYLQTPPHPPPPPAAQPPPPPPELYQNINNFRLSATTPFGQNQQLNNPTTVLISSTSNSLMSASVKPSGQQISAIGTKAGGVGQAYQQQSQQGQQVYMAYDPSIQANYLASNAGVMQRAPVGPAQNNVVPGLQPSSSYYSGSTGGQSGFFQQPNNNAQLSQHQAGYGLQGNMFGTHNQSHTNTALQNYNSHFLTTPMQMAAALNAQQQFRSNLPAAYMKSVGDQSGRSQQLKSPSSQEVLSSVFNSGPQIPSPKSRQNMKHPPQQSSPTSQHKFNMYQQGVGGPSNMNMQRYPTPIQRPINFQQMQQQQQNSANQKHRNNPNGNKPRYYGNQNHSLSAQSEKCDDAKINDGVSNAPGAAKGVAATGADGVKENLKEEAVALKD